MSVSLDGTTTFWRGEGFRIADGAEGTLALWLRPGALGAIRVPLAITNNASSSAGLSLAIGTTGLLTLVGRTAASSLVLTVFSTVALAANTWYLILASWNLTTPTVKLYVNDTDRTNATVLSTGVLDYTKDQVLVGAQDSASGKIFLFNGDLDYVYFATSYIDLSVEANRRRFYGPRGEQIGLGPEARRPTGNRPELFLAGGAGNFGRNLGTGGDLAAAGSPTHAAGRPAAVETLARGFRGELWRESQRSGIPFPSSELVYEPATGLEVGRREYSTDRDEMRRGWPRRVAGRGGR